MLKIVFVPLLLIVSLFFFSPALAISPGPAGFRLFFNSCRSVSSSYPDRLDSSLSVSSRCRESGQEESEDGRNVPLSFVFAV